MKGSLRRIFSLGVVVLFIAQYNSIAQTITSTGTGGNWEVSSTWIGGVVPSASTDVVISGPVSFATGPVPGYSCRNLTVNSGGDLSERTGYYEGVQILTVNGNVTNNGTVRNVGSRGFVLRVKGNITNNATWTILRIELNGTGTQTLSAGSGKKFECAVTVDTTARPAIAAGSDLVFTGGFDLGKSTLDMKSFTVSLNGAGANIYNGSVINAKDISGAPVKDQYGTPAYPILDNITYDGSPNIKGRFLINSNVTLKGSVTVSDTVEEKTGYYDYEKTLWIKGALVNNGIIRSVGRGIVVNVTGNVTNNGKWTFNRTELNGTSDQTLLLSTGKLFESSFKSMDSLGLIIAGSNLSFTGGFDLGRSTLDMKSFAVSLNGAGANIYNGNVINAKDISGAPVKDQYGTPAYPILDNITYDGSPNIKGRFLINTNVTLKGSITVSDTLEEKTGYYDYEKTLWIKGSLVNNGIIRSVGRGLALNVTGNLTNNGRWVHARTDLSGTSNQTLTLAVDKLFEAAFRVTDSLGMIVAGSNLTTTSWFDLRKCVLDMKNYSLTLQGSGATVYSGFVINVKDIIGVPLKDQYGTPVYPTLDNITYDGNPNIKGRFLINSNVTLKGAVTVSDTIEEKTGYYEYEKTLWVKGNLVNNGTVRSLSRGLALDVTGNVTTNKPFTNNRIQLAGNGNRTIVDLISKVTYLSTGEKVVLYGENYLPSLSIDSKSKCLLANGSNIYTANGLLDPALDNWSCITITKKFTGVQDYPFFRSRIKVLANAAIDSVRIQSFGHQVPSTFAGAVKSWWRVRTFASNTRQSFSSMTFLYDHELLGTSTELGLQIYQSVDSGMTWQQVSTSINTARDTATNSIT
ncbi:MAG: hypothetical protein NTZ35_11580, partial [Ignavibacteriales bacterium]|nr:hypothetical protein [Ignavibacteriales bacterium]